MIVDNEESLETMENEKVIGCFERHSFTQAHNQYQSADSVFFRTLAITLVDKQTEREREIVVAIEFLFIE